MQLSKNKIKQINQEFYGFHGKMSLNIWTNK